MIRLAVLITLAMTALAAADGPRSTIPVEKRNNRHEELLKVAKAGNVDLLFIGDSITAGWEKTGKAAWQQHFAPLKAASLGDPGDRTENLLWRLRNGELQGLRPRLAVLMIGTNNVNDTPQDVVLGIQANITEIQQHCPGTRILLLGIFPRSERPDAARARNEAVNRLLPALARPQDPKRVVYMDISAKFLDADQTLPKSLFSDGVHPNAKGYQVWAEAIIDTVKEQMKASAR